MRSLIIDRWCARVECCNKFHCSKMTKKNDKIKSLIFHDLAMCAWMMVWLGHVRSSCNLLMTPFGCALCVYAPRRVHSRVWEEERENWSTEFTGIGAFDGFLSFSIAATAISTSWMCCLYSGTDTLCVATIYYIRSVHATDWHFDDTPLGCDNNRQFMVGLKRQRHHCLEIAFSYIANVSIRKFLKTRQSHKIVVHRQCRWSIEPLLSHLISI